MILNYPFTTPIKITSTKLRKIVNQFLGRKGNKSDKGWEVGEPLGIIKSITKALALLMDIKWDCTLIAIQLDALKEVVLLRMLSTGKHPTNLNFPRNWFKDMNAIGTRIGRGRELLRQFHLRRFFFCPVRNSESCI